jgi:hypothetical protein
MEAKINSNDRDKINSHFLNLFSLAISDAEVTTKELELLYSIGIENGVSSDEVDYLIDNPHKVKFVKPSSTDGILEQLFDFCRMILADQKVDVREVMFFKSLTSHLDITESKSERILDVLVDGLKVGEEKSSLITKVKQIYINN